MINVTKTFLPPFKEYSALLKRAWDKEWITNNGELVQELEQKLKEYLGVKHLLFTTNGTVVLQMALKAYNITGEIITTPFSYVATTNAILWENCTPVFIDINPRTFCIDENKIEAAISENTQAILATHVYGMPCNVEKIEKIASKYQLRVIYDGAHAFGCTYKGKALLAYGDISTCSFHATKIFHTVEGGCIICSDDELAKKLMLYRSFGHTGDEYFSIGINAKNSEFHAAMGLAVLPHLSNIIKERRDIFLHYNSRLRDVVTVLNYCHDGFDYNYSYYPVLFKDEETLQRVKQALLDQGVNARRYFYPSLNKLPYIYNSSKCQNSEEVSSKVLSLPLYVGLTEPERELIIEILVKETR